MKRIFEQGEFKNYSTTTLDEARSSIKKSYQFAVPKTTIFISHKHDELDDLKDVLGFFEHNYNAKIYIDSRDSSLPVTTSGETASGIKTRISECDKFILLATNGAVESKWCNWELGFGDAKKFKKNIALFPMKPSGELDSNYKGSEYMSIYPSVTYYNGGELYKNGNPIAKGYYVRIEKENGENTITPLGKWLVDK